MLNTGTQMPLMQALTPSATKIYVSTLPRQKQAE